METTDGGCSKLLSGVCLCRELRGQLPSRAAGGRYAEIGVIEDGRGAIAPQTN